MPFRYPESAVFYRNLRRDFPKIVRGEGVWLTDDSGRKYLDASGGACVVNCGHGVPEIARALGESAERLAYVNGTAFTHEAVEDLAAEMALLMPPGLDKFYFLTSGSEAVEAALKLARQYWVETGRPEKHKILSLEPGYHGNTLLALSASGRPSYQTLYGPYLSPSCVKIPAPYAYRCPCGGTDSCPVCSGEALDEAIRREGPGTVSAFIAEPVGGTSTGASVPRPGYWKKVREICDRHKILWIADEVLSGAGRTGKWLALEHFGALPDIAILGKGLSSGYAPLSCVAASARLLDPIARGSGAFSHAQTHSHAPLICAAGLATLRLLKSRSLISRAADLGPLLGRKLSALRGLPGIGDVRGIGMLWAVEFVSDKASRKPYPPGLGVAQSFARAARGEGLVVWPHSGFWKGEGDLAVIAPPFTISEAEMDELVSRFRKSWAKTQEDVLATTKGGGIR